VPQDDDLARDEPDDAAEQTPDAAEPSGRVTVSAANRRTPRGTLSRQVLLDSAREIVDIGGVNALSMRALGARLGVDPTAIYRHFQNKNELLDALADLMIRGDEPLPATGDPAEDLRANLRQLRGQLLRYPTLGPSVLRQPPGTGAWWDRMEHAFGALRATGHTDADAAATWQTLLFFVVGHALVEARHLAENLATDRVGAPMPTVNPPRSRYPELAGAAPYLHADLTDQFEAGLERILG